MVKFMCIINYKKYMIQFKVDKFEKKSILAFQIQKIQKLLLKHIK